VSENKIQPQLRLYDDKDLNDYVSTILSKSAQFFGGLKTNQYLLAGDPQQNGHFASATKEQYLVALAGAVSSDGRFNHPVDYYLDKAKQPSPNMMINCLKKILPQLAQLNQRDVAILRTQLATVLLPDRYDDAALFKLMQLLHHHKFSPPHIHNEITTREQNLTPVKDVFDELMPKLTMGTQETAKIIMNYNLRLEQGAIIPQQGKFDLSQYAKEARHHMPVECIIQRSHNSYQIQIMAHDSFGGVFGLTASNFSTLKSAVEKRIHAEHLRITGKVPTIIVTHNRTPYPRRQQDASSCGPITAEETLDLALGNDLATRAPYAKDATELRRHQLQRMKQLDPTDSTGFTKRNEEPRISSTSGALPEKLRQEITQRSAQITERTHPQTSTRYLQHLMGELDKLPTLASTKDWNGDIHFKDKNGEIILKPLKSGRFEIMITGSINGTLQIPRYKSELYDIVDIQDGKVVNKITPHNSIRDESQDFGLGKSNVARIISEADQQDDVAKNTNQDKSWVQRLAEQKATTALQK
jgi:hypothetical protein